MHHPLDPLTAAEIKQVAALVRSRGDISLHFKAISIIEPPKKILRAYLAAERGNVRTDSESSSLPTAVAPPARRASALYYHRGTANLFLATLDLDRNVVEDARQLEPHFHGQADVDEAVELRDMCLAHPKVVEAIRNFKLPENLTVVCDGWPYGRDSETSEPRLVQVCVHCSFLPKYAMS
jgi:primary-amine oxidase